MADNKRPQSNSSQTGSSQAGSSQAAPRLMERRWAVLGGMVLSAMVVVLFVSNVLRVGKLTEEMERMKKEHQRLVHQNELLRGEIIRLQSPERITTVAKTRLGLVPASSAPVRIASAPKKP